MWLNCFKDSEETVSAMAYAGFCQRGSLPSLFWGAHRDGDKGVSLRKIIKLAASPSPSKNCRAAAVRKTATRRLLSRIISELVVNASSRRRRVLGDGVDCSVVMSMVVVSFSLATSLSTCDHWETAMNAAVMVSGTLTCVNSIPTPSLHTSSTPSWSAMGNGRFSICFRQR